MENWKINILEKKDMTNSTLIVGLPGIGNVGKIVADFLVNELKAIKVCEFFSYHMPNCVFVQEDNLVAMPKIELYFKNTGKLKLIVLTGDSQPIDEIGCYSFCDMLLDFFQENKSKEIITLGGIGLNNIPKQPKIYCTGNNKKIIDRYVRDTNMTTKVYGIVGPILGVSGLLLGLAKKRKIEAVSLLAETFGHPMFLGLKGGKEILIILKKKLFLDVDLKNLEKEINEMESKMKITDDLGKVTKRKMGDKSDVNYIG